MIEQVKKVFENYKAQEEAAEEKLEIGLVVIDIGEVEQNQPSMANTISNMKMTNPIKGLVSKRRKRFKEDGFDLDLTCILFNLLSKLFIYKYPLYTVIKCVITYSLTTL